MHFDYDGDPKVALSNIKKILENEGFKIIEYAPEDGFLFTDYKEFNWGTGRRIIAVTAHVHDKIIITGMGSMDIPVTNLGRPDELLKIKKNGSIALYRSKKSFLEFNTTI